VAIYQEWYDTLCNAPDPTGATTRHFVMAACDLARVALLSHAQGGSKHDDTDWLRKMGISNV
jgi:hypothetical protein